MDGASYGLGEIVFAREALYNDGSLPDAPDGALLAAAGARGVVVKAGHVEGQPGLEIFAVRFEDADQVLGPPVGCFVHELTQDCEPAVGA
ncbi:nitrogen fixation protein NifZ [Pseudothauera rhizosphaerae]|uniref:Nitrogen fixation protein NifZ n=1 Tax=Pseudothauera rhizosphaerae TaxID=2565932 RepID=A0A4S4AJ90_9RHOO|nr:nitrogen fixation protein NifZ [Pseudothauera rhizosphaerae]THF59465.1 nitrogen fixation protein NifZ [Pseudothauera rhizosphaerae]